MDHKIIASRLTFIFILAVVLSGSVLTWFSINNISNLKELTEKRILEEQREISARFIATIENRLTDATTGLFGATGSFAVLKESLLKYTSENDFIVQPFILKKNGQFIYPNFTGIAEDFTEAEFSGRFKSAFSAGQTAEFSEKNLRKAREIYLACLNHSTGSSDSAKALNALGRISIKLNNKKDAVTFYNSVVSRYYPVKDENGISYIYYALPQLLKVSDPGNREQIIEAVVFCLERMEAGYVPLSYNTEDFLILVTNELLKESISDNPQKTATVKRHVENIKHQIQFIKTYGNDLSDLMIKGISGSNASAGNDFIIVKPSSGNNREYFLINTDSENPTGYLIDSNGFLNSIAKSVMQPELEFEYQINFPLAYNHGTTGKQLVYSSPLTPYFSDQLLEIELRDKTLIENIVKRRGLIYGIASLFLLVAMFLGVILILRDIRREKHLARVRSDFISNVTHELKTPLTSIRMYAESILMGRVKSDSMQKEYLSVVVNETDRLKRMINNILEFSKMEKGKPEYHLIRTNLALLFKESIQGMNYWFEKEQFEVVTELDEAVYADVDPEKIKQAVDNLLSNAIKYSADTKKVFIRLFRKSDKVSIEVEDRGIGIPKDKLSRIFEQFYRIEQKEGTSGTGLGLTVVKEIIEAHFGTISVTSEPGKGSKFVITLNQEAEKSENNPGNRR